jgi:hypothetical protein
MHFSAINVLSVCAGLLIVSSPADVRAQELGPVQLSALDGKDQQPPPCGKDGLLNCNACANDPDCPLKGPGSSTPPPSTSLPTAIVESRCAGKIAVFGVDTPFGVAARQVASRYPNFKTARKADDPSYIDSHPTGMLATGHGELKGYGVTMIQGKRSGVVENASGDLADPPELFFQKVGGDEDDWGIIGMGYSYQHDRDDEGGPTQISGVDPGIWWLHEAGYHRSPGDGGFTCATNDDLQKSAFEAGKRIDPEGCTGIDRDHLKTREFSVDRKHGRYWVLHVWFEPSTRRPTLALTDPWCRQSADALPVPSCAFRKQGSC